MEQVRRWWMTVNRTQGQTGSVRADARSQIRAVGRGSRKTEHVGSAEGEGGAGGRSSMLAYRTHWFHDSYQRNERRKTDAGLG